MNNKIAKGVAVKVLPVGVVKVALKTKLATVVWRWRHRLDVWYEAGGKLSFRQGEGNYGVLASEWGSLVEALLGL